MKPRIYNKEEHRVNRRAISGNALKVLRRLTDEGFEAYLVGGGVRDLLLGEQPKDFDIVTNAHPNEIRGVFRNSRIIGRRFRLVHVLYGRDVVEVATFRASDNKESQQYQKSDSGFLVRDNIYGEIDEDAFRRDFTINALYYEANDELVLDYCNGYEDLQAGIIRLIGDPDERFREDPVRILRAIRFEAKLGFTIEESLLAPMQEHAELLRLVSPSRMYDEVIKLFLTGHGVESYKKLVKHNLFGLLFPATYESLKSDGELKGHLLVASLDNSDFRHYQGRNSSPYFLYASLLWAAVVDEYERLLADGMRANPAIERAANRVFNEQGAITAFPRYVKDFITELWFFQSRLTAEGVEQEVEQILRHDRFKAAYDFLLLRAVAEESEFIIRRANFWREKWEAYERENPQLQKRRGSRRNQRRR